MSPPRANGSAGVKTTRSSRGRPRTTDEPSYGKNGASRPRPPAARSGVAVVAGPLPVVAQGLRQARPRLPAQAAARVDAVDRHRGARGQRVDGQGGLAPVRSEGDLPQ